MRFLFCNVYIISVILLTHYMIEIVVFCCLLHQQNCSTLYNWNIVEIGINNT